MANYNKVKKARKALMLYGDITEPEQHEVIALALQAEREKSIPLELKVLHILFRRPVEERINMSTSGIEGGGKYVH